MKKSLFFYAIFAIMFAFVSCKPEISSMSKLETLAAEIETNHAYYTNADWDSVLVEYEILENKILESEYTDEELYKIGRIKGKIAGYITKHALRNMDDALKEFEGGLKGFIEAINE